MSSITRKPLLFNFDKEIESVLILASNVCSPSSMTKSYPSDFLPSSGVFQFSIDRQNIFRYFVFERDFFRLHLRR